MNREAISNTIVCYWSKDDKAYVAESPLFETIAGVGATEHEARKVFDRLLADAYEAYLEGRVPGYEKPGRPTKGRLPLNIDVKPESKYLIKILANQFECSQGEVIDFLAYAYQKQKESKPLSYIDKEVKSKKDLYTVFQKMHDLKVSIDHLETEWSPMPSKQHKSTSSAKQSNSSKVKQKSFIYPTSQKS